VAQILAVVSDLMLASRVKEGLLGAGHAVSVQASLPESFEADAIVCDLDAVDAGAVAAAEVPSLGFYSHLDTATRARAEEAGLDLIVPRSRMARELPQLLEALLAAR
jgi:hypothetical protein